MYAAPSCRRTYLPSALIRFLHAKVLCYTLSQAYQRGNGYDERDPECAAAFPIRGTGGAMAAAKKHAQRDEQVAQDFCVAGQGIG